jgi:uracil-DNA glycosylase family protein
MKKDVPERKVASKKSSESDAENGVAIGATAFLPAHHDIPSLKEASLQCEGCELYKYANGTVFGEGPANARVIFVGEQPGDSEDKQGRPFVGPAGRLLDKILEELDIPRELCYVTNTVKHFKYEWRGKNRLHKKPRQIEVNACLPWLKAEIGEIKPEIIVLLGATAAQAVFGKTFRVTKDRGRVLPGPPSGALAKMQFMATVHPSSILRAVDDESRTRELALFKDDLKLIKDFV